MKKLLYILPVLIAFMACQKDDDFNYKMNEIDPSDIDSVFLSAGTSKILADGKAAISFHVEAFRTITSEVGGEIIENKLAVDIKKLPPSALRIIDEMGEVVDQTYLPTESAITKSFYAQIGEAQSEIETVDIYTTNSTHDKLYVDIIFQVMELKETDDKYDPLTYKKIEYQDLVSAVVDLNRVFNNQIGNSPNAASANIEFRLAKTDKWNSPMSKPGYYEIAYDSDNAANIETFIAELDDYYNGARYWDHKRYLNIFVMPFSGDLKTSEPNFQYVDEENALPGMGDTTDSPDLETSQLTYRNLAAAVNRSVFLQGPETRFSIADVVGKFYGLSGTSHYDTEFDDYCSDTQKYVSTGQANQIIKTGLNGEKFRAANAMDNVSHATFRNHITVDQVARIRFALDNCPGRMNGLLE